MLYLDHLTLVAPTLTEGVQHVKDCLGIEVPFGTKHYYMGTHNHRLQLGDNVYLEIVALDPDGTNPKRARWFGLDNQAKVREDWEQKQRLRGWVAATTSIDKVVSTRPEFGEVVSLPFNEPEFAFTIPVEGSLPMDGVLPSLIDHKDNPTEMSEIPDLGAQLISFTMRHPDPEKIESIYKELNINRPPEIRIGQSFRYEAVIKMPGGLCTLW